MPFTFAHPAAVLWCTRFQGIGVPFSAFVIGAMSPDFEYLLRLQVYSVYAHTLPGILWFCVPVGLLVFLIFQCVVAEPLRAHLPPFARQRLDRAIPLPHIVRPQTLFVTCAAIAFGALTHVVWDGFTHFNGVFVARLPVLQYAVAGFPLHRFLQHGSTLGGFLLIACWFHRLPRTVVPEVTRTDRAFWPVVAGGGLLGFLVLNTLAPYPGWKTWILCNMNSIGLGLVTGGLWVRRKPGNTGNDLAV